MYNIDEIKNELIIKFYGENYDFSFEPFIDKLVAEICDINVECINPLSVDDSRILRDNLGINKIRARISQSKIGIDLGVSRSAISLRIKRIYSILKKRVNVDYCAYLTAEKDKIVLLTSDIFSLGLSVRTYNLLKRNNINTVYDLVSRPFESLKDIDFIGPKILDEIYEKVHLNGLSFNLNFSLTSTKKRSDYTNLLLSESIESLGLSTRAYNCLKRNSIDTVDDLINNTYQYISQLKHLGVKASIEIYDKVHNLGLYFLDEENDFDSISYKKYKLLLVRRNALQKLVDNVNLEIKDLEKTMKK